VETGVFPLYEVVNGAYRITHQVPELKPVEAYLRPQGRFRHLTPDLLEQIQKYVREDYEKLLAKASR
jgi:pyruvate ferredoxin oxidoreductase beta subunit